MTASETEAGVGRRRARLARLGFADAERAERLLGPENLDLWRPETGTPSDPDAALVVSALGRAGDPDLAVLALCRLAEGLDGVGPVADRAGLLRRLRSSGVLRFRLIALLGASSALGDHLVANPVDWRLLDDEPPLSIVDDHWSALLGAVGADPSDPPTGTGGTPARGTGPDIVDALRTAYRRRLLVLAASDLIGEITVEELTADLADLAAATLSAALAIALAGLPAGAAPCRLAVVGMGKCGGRELNYVSDVDVVFVAEPGSARPAGRGSDLAGDRPEPGPAGAPPGAAAAPPPGPVADGVLAAGPAGPVAGGPVAGGVLAGGPADPVTAGPVAGRPAGPVTGGPARPTAAGPVAGGPARPTAGGMVAGAAAAPVAGGSVETGLIAGAPAAGRSAEPVSAEPVSAEPVDEGAALQTAAALASEMVRICARVAWPVDCALRPEGRLGTLVRTLASHQAYYRRWARTWEFQALLKARPVAGDLALGQSYVDTLAPLVWTASERDHFVEDVQSMRRRVEDTLTTDVAERELKLGPGGLRDVEFAVQLLQLVHGRADETLRSGSTLAALAALADGGYIGRDDGAKLADSYRFLRTTEHRLQLQRLRRTHLVPDDHAGLTWLARSLGYRPDRRGNAVQVFAAERALHARDVRRLHQKLFYRPLLNAVSRVPSEQLRLTPEAARKRLTALGFGDPEGALRHLSALTTGVSRRAAIQRALLPVMLESFADAPEPDAGLLAYRQVSDALGETPWYLRLLRDSGQVADRLALLLGSSRYVADLLARAPEALQLLAADEELRPRPADRLRSSFRAAAARHMVPAEAVGAARGLRRHELLRIASADLLGRLDLVDVGTALSDTAAATVAAALDVASRSVAASRGGTLPTRVAVIAMGRLGGAELGYGSDADVMFVHEPEPDVPEREAADAATAVAEELRRLLALPAPDPPLLIDANLRPEGRSGPLVRTLAAYAAYYARWSSFWEAQALLRAAPLAGDAELGARFLALADQRRYPAEGLPAEAVTEIRRLKARMESERLPRGADPATHTKLGPGGLADVEWTVQLLQLQYGATVPGLRTTRTLDALVATRDAELLSADDAAALEAAWRVAAQARSAVMLVRGRASDQLPRHGRELVGIARAMGYPPGRDPGQFLDDYRRATRRARRVVERVFYS
ncbi:MAG: [glutamine synthetase] adenylyltransferase / [glutamine synthetase]-adenylyl-L-tyrosine [Mycobacteriales bacterium]